MRTAVRPPGTPPQWCGPLVEVERYEWRTGDPGDPVAALADLLAAHGLGGPLPSQRGDSVVVLLAGAAGCARLADLPAGAPSPVYAVPEVAALVLRRGHELLPTDVGRGAVGPWTTTWSDAEHAAGVETVRAAIARGDLYQANVVGHRSAAHRSDPRCLATAVAALPGATYGGVLSGDGWAVGCASPEQLVRVDTGRITTIPIKGTLPVSPGSREALLTSEKDLAEHVMIVDLQRNDLSRVARTGTVDVERFYELVDWSGLWQAASTVAATVEDGVTSMAVLRALLPGGSVTGAPKRAAWTLLADLEPVGRGPSMGALGLLWPGGMDLGLTIRTIGASEDRVHLWAGGGITWGSDAEQEVAEAHAKAAPVRRALD